MRVVRGPGTTNTSYKSAFRVATTLVPHKDNKRETYVEFVLFVNLILVIIVIIIVKLILGGFPTGILSLLGIRRAGLNVSMAVYQYMWKAYLGLLFGRRLLPPGSPRCAGSRLSVSMAVEISMWKALTSGSGSGKGAGNFLFGLLRVLGLACKSARLWGI